MILSAHQPQYLPYLGFWHKLLNSDIHVIFDDVKFTRGAFINRNRIKNAKGWEWLTIPVKRVDCKISELIAVNSKWRVKHLKSLKTNYSRAQHFDDHIKYFEGFYNKDSGNVSDINTTLIKDISKMLGIKTKIIMLSDVDVEGDSTERIVNLCSVLKCHTYLSGTGGKDYLDESLFQSSGVKLVYQDFKHPTHPQLFGKFIPNLSIVDSLLNCGKGTTDLINNQQIYL
jgi:hypothetical protein